MINKLTQRHSYEDVEQFHKYTIQCPCCGIILNFGKDDVYKAEDNCLIHHEYIDCPECNEKIQLNDEENLSEDEKIRKSLIEYFGSYHSGSAITNDVVVEDVLAWLEKQDTKFQEYINEEQNKKDFYCEGKEMSWNEMPLTVRKHDYPYYFKGDLDCYPFNVEKQCKQKSSDKIEPKFKVGDWIVYNRNNYSREILYVYDIRDGRYYFNDNIHFSWSVKECDEKSHLWTIQDAKDGDVVVDKSDGTIGIFQSIGHHPDGGSYNDPSYCFLHCRYDDGFFYADFENGNTMDSYDAIPSTKEQCDLLFAKMKEEGYEWDAEKKELKKINTACSKEDEKMIEACLLFVNANRTHPLATKCIDWLTSIKDRVQPQPKQELSKEDSERLLRIHQFIWANRKGDTDEIYQQEQDADWLMSIIPQPNQYDKGYEDGYSAAKYNQWKPTNKQMEDFRMLLDYNIGVFDYAKFMSADSLYEDLKKNLID